MALKTIKSQIIVAMLTCSVLVAVVIGGISISKSIDMMAAQTREKLGFLAQSKADHIDQTILTVQNYVDALTAYSESHFEPGQIANPSVVKRFISQASPVVKRLSEKVPYNMSAYIYMNVDLAQGLYGTWFVQNDAGEFEFNPDLGSMDDFADPNDVSMAYYFVPVKTRQSAWSEPYEDKDIHVNMITYSAPIMVGGQPIGVTGMDISFDNLQKMVRDIRVYQSGYALLVDKNFKLLASQKYPMGEALDKVAKGQFKPLVEHARTRPGEVFEAVVQGQDSMITHTTLSNGFQMFVIVPKAEVFAEMNQLLLFLTALTLGCLLVAVVFAAKMGARLARPIEQVIACVHALAHYDLTVDIADDNSQSEMGELKRSFKRLLQSMRQMVDNMSQSSRLIEQNARAVGEEAASAASGAEQVNAKITQLSSGAKHIALQAGELSSGSNQIALNIQQLAEGTQEQAASLSKLAVGSEQQRRSISKALSDIEVINQAIQTISDNVQQTVGLSQTTQTFAEEGYHKSQQAVDKIYRIREAASSAGGQIRELGQLGENINTIIKTMRDIANQTNLLALNASIQASKAGSYGLEFVAIADEVKKLAQNSLAASGEISGLLDTIQTLTHSAVDSMNHGETEIDEGVAILGEVSQSLADISGAARTTSSNVSAISVSTHQVAQSSENVVDMVKTVESTLEDITLNIQGLSSITEQAAANSREISTITHKTADNAQAISEVTQESASSTGIIESAVKTQSQSLSHIYNSAAALGQVSQQLCELVSQYKR